MLARPTYEVTIAGVPVPGSLLASFRITETLDAADTLLLDIPSTAAPYIRPAVGQALVVTENGVRVFGGTVRGVRERGLVGPTHKIVVEVQGSSHEINADRRVVTRAFNDPTGTDTIGSALAALVSEYYAAVGVSLHPAQTAGPVLPTARFDRMPGGAVNANLAASVGYLQGIDFENRLRAWAPGDIRAPFDYDELVNPRLLTGDLEVERQLANGYANRIVLSGEPQETDATQRWIADGTTQLFHLNRTPKYWWVVVFDETNHYETVGTAPAMWIIDPAAKTIRRIDELGPPPAGTILDFRYIGIFEPSAAAEDAAEIAAYGLYEYAETVTTVPDNVSAQEYANQILARKIASKDEIATLPTMALGFHPGQMMHLSSPSRAILPGDFLITQVETAAPSGGAELVRHLTCARSGTNTHDWRRVYQQWAGTGGVGAITSGGAPVPPAPVDPDAGSRLHAETHRRDGIDPIKLDDLDVPDDTTDLDVSSSAHGLTPKISGADGDVLTIEDGLAVWAPPTGGGGGGSGGPPAVALLAALTAASSGTLDFTTRNQNGYTGAIFQTDFDLYAIEFIGVLPAVDNVDLYSRVSQDGGATWLSATAAYFYGGHYFNNAAAGGHGVFNDTPFTSTAALIGNGIKGFPAGTGVHGVYGTLRMWEPAAATTYHRYEGIVSFYAQAGTIDNRQIIGWITGAATTAINAIRFYFTSGAIAAGTIKIYGVGDGGAAGGGGAVGPHAATHYTGGTDPIAPLTAWPEYFNQALRTTDVPTFAGLTATGQITGQTWLQGQDLRVVDRAFFDALGGGIYLSDWLNQALKTSSSPTFGQVFANCNSPSYVISDDYIWAAQRLYVQGFRVTVTADCTIPSSGGGGTPLPPNVAYLDAPQTWPALQTFSGGITVNGVNWTTYFNQAVRTDSSPTFTNLTLSNALTVNTNVSSPRYDSAGETGVTQQLFIRDVAGGSVRLRFVGGVCTFFGPQTE